jgi:hypothetical protein
MLAKAGPSAKARSDPKGWPAPHWRQLKLTISDVGDPKAMRQTVKVVHRTSALGVDALELRIANRNRRPLSRLAGVCLVGILLVASGCSSEAPTAASETPVARGIAAAPSSTPATTNSSSPQTVSPQSMSTQAADALIASAGPATAMAALGTLVVQDSAESTG